ncbi:hypothetical protein, partial [Profundibacterium mesophilum]|uniref:hypothetical protein n=1 Tax=Profundibacterium mesophilum TaxID=1258573 RepID=UPI00135B8188
DTKSYPIELLFNGAGIFELSYYWTGRLEAGDVPMRLTPSDQAIFNDFAPSYVRIHRFIKSDPHSNYLAQVTDEAGQEGFSLPQHLDI